MNKGLKIGIWIGIAAGLGFGTWFVIDSINKSNDQKEQDKKAKEEADKALKEALEKGSVKQTTPFTLPGTMPNATDPKPVVTTTNTNTSITGKVSDLVLKHGDTPLYGKKVYSNYNNTNVYNTVNKLYTIAKAGQYLGTYAYSKNITLGGKNIFIKTTDPANPYVYVRADFLKV